MWRLGTRTGTVREQIGLESFPVCPNQLVADSDGSEVEDFWGDNYDDVGCVRLVENNADSDAHPDNVPHVLSDEDNEVRDGPIDASHGHDDFDATREQHWHEPNSSGEDDEDRWAGNFDGMDNEAERQGEDEHVFRGKIEHPLLNGVLSVAVGLGLLTHWSNARLAMRRNWVILAQRHGACSD